MKHKRVITCVSIFPDETIIYRTHTNTSTNVKRYKTGKHTSNLVYLLATNPHYKDITPNTVPQWDITYTIK